MHSLSVTKNKLMVCYFRMDVSKYIYMENTDEIEKKEMKFKI